MTAVGDLAPLTIDRVIHGGRGMGRWQGLPVFVSGTLAGERVAARVTAQRKGYVEAALDRLLTPSIHRREPPCAVYPACGGCQLQHAAYDAQLDIKRGIVHETLQRLGGLDVDVPPVVPSPQPFGYRLRAQLKISRLSGGLALGFFAAGSHSVVSAPGCLVLHPRLQAVLVVLQDLASRRDSPLAGARAVELQTTAAGSACLVVLHLDSPRRTIWPAIARELEAVVPLGGVVAYTPQTRGVVGRDWLEERIDDVGCRVSDRTFLQVNAGANAALVATVTSWAALSGRDRVVDLYAGFGNLSLPLARHGRVTAVESSPSAAADARCNVRASGRSVRVIARRVETWTPAADDRRPDLVVLDPPRSGLTGAALARVLALDAPRLLYVSCEPATLARDARRLVEAGYRLFRVASFDFFPQTAHVETLAELRRD